MRKRLTDYSELTFFSSNSNNLLKNKINCVSLFQISLYEEVWWHVIICNKLNQSKFEGYFFNNIARTHYRINDNITAGETLGQSDRKSNVNPSMIFLVTVQPSRY
jgi:hypothetical protein